EKVWTSVDLPLSHGCKRILAYGAEEAARLGHKHIGTAHLLLGILKEEKCFAAALLHERGLQLSAVREEFERSQSAERAPAGLTAQPWWDRGQPAAPARQAAPAIAFGRFTEPAMRAALFAYQEATDLGSPTIDVEHLLLGVLRQDGPEATRLLRSDA